MTNNSLPKGNKRNIIWLNGVACRMPEKKQISQAENCQQKLKQALVCLRKLSRN